MYSLKSIAALLALALIAIGCGEKESPTQPGDSVPTPSIVGRVSDAVSGASIAGAIVSTIPPTRSVSTDAAGNFAIGGLPNGRYTVIANKSGYGTGSAMAPLFTSSDTVNITLVAGANNQVPRVPSDPAPADGAVGVVYEGGSFSWTGGDPDGDSVSYDIYFGTTSPPLNQWRRGDPMSTSEKLPVLGPSATYYWSVVARDSHGSIVSGPVWTFKSAGPYAVQIGKGAVSVDPAPDLDLSGRSFTIEAWVRPDQAPSGKNDYQWVISKSAGSDDVDYLLGVNDNGMFRFAAGDAGHDIVSATPAVPGTLYHIAGVVDMDQHLMMLYVDGWAVAIMPIDSMKGTVSEAPLLIGSRAGAEYFRGVIDEVRIWNVARTQPQINDGMRRRLKGSQPGLVAYWQFDEERGSITPDVSGHGHDGFLSAEVLRIPSPFLLP